MTHWITTHWPAPEPNWPRHVYFKSGWTPLPEIDDVVYVYEANRVTINGKQIKAAHRVHEGVAGPELALPHGFGGLIGSMKVAELPRKIRRQDLVYEYAPRNLEEWSIVPCHRFVPALTPLPLVDLVSILGMPERTPAIRFNLCKVCDQFVPELVTKLSTPNRVGGD
jgi:hypothetical protein